MKKIILTYDYEVYFGSPSSDPVLSLLKNTDLILSKLKELNKVAVFFIDTLFLIELKKNELKLFEKFAEQVERIHKEGHEIGLHLHPHWLDSEYVSSGIWKFPTYRRFRVSSLSKNEIHFLATQSIELLKNINSDIEVVSFRAGGWCAQPFSAISAALLDLGIFIDSSVIPGFKSTSTSYHQFDYIQTPQSPFWKFTENPCQSDQVGHFTEVPVSTIKLTGFDLLINRLLLKKQNFQYLYMGKGAVGEDSVTSKFKRIFSLQMRKISFESNSSWIVKKMLKNYKSDLIVMVMHPKTLSRQELNHMDHFLPNYQTVLLKELSL